jgi:hypothetical protein
LLHQDEGILDRLLHRTIRGLIISFVQELGKSAAQEAFAFIEHKPDERERITQLVRMTHRCASIEGIMDRLGDTTNYTSHHVRLNVASRKLTNSWLSPQASWWQVSRNNDPTDVFKLYDMKVDLMPVGDLRECMGRAGTREASLLHGSETQADRLSLDL